MALELLYLEWILEHELHAHGVELFTQPAEIRLAPHIADRAIAADLFDKHRVIEYPSDDLATQRAQFRPCRLQLLQAYLRHHPCNIWTVRQSCRAVLRAVGFLIAIEHGDGR